MSFFSRFRWHGLRLKILVWTFVPTALALVAVGLVSFYAFQTTTRNLLIENNRELVHLLAAQLSSELDEYAAILSDLERWQGFSRATPDQQQAILVEKGGLLGVFDAGVIVTDQHGIVTAAEPLRPELIGADLSKRSYFREMIRSNTPMFSDVVYDGPKGVAVIVVAVPLYGPQDEFLGMAAGMFRLGATNISTFYGDIVKLRIGQSDVSHLNTYLVDSQGQAIYHNNSKQIGENLSNLAPVEHFLAGIFVDQFSNPAQARTNFGANTGALRSLDSEGRDVVAYYAQVPGTSWVLVTESSWNGILSYYQAYQVVQVLLFVLGVVVPALIVAFGIRRLTEPIYALKTAATEVAGGNFDRQIQVRSGDELEELVEHFNHMARRLSQSYAAIKEREERLAFVLQATNDGIWDWNISTGEVYFSPRWKEMLGYADHDIENRFEKWLNMIHPDDVAISMDTLQKYIEGSTNAFALEHRMKHKDGGYRWILTRGILIRDEAGNPARMVGSHSDITARKNAQEALRNAYETLEERVQERTRDLEALNAVSSLVNRSLDLNEILSSALEKTLQVMKMEFGVAFRLEGEQQGKWLSPEEASLLAASQLFLNPLAHHGLPETWEGSLTRIPLSMGNQTILLDQDTPFIWELDRAADPNIMGYVQKMDSKLLVSIPLKVKNRLVGVIQLGTNRIRQFTDEEMELLTAVGRQVGVAVENARLHEAVQRSATLEERARLARELHDSVTQSLYSVTLLAEASSRLLTSGETQTAAEHLAELRDAAQESLREMRLLIYELRPAAIEKSGLAESVELRLEAVESRSGIKTDLIVEGKEQLPYTIKSELYHMAQESLNNILKHSHASHVRVSLRFQERLTCMEIWDNGVGFNPALAATSGGLGLAGLSERAEKIGAELHIESVPGKGTRISVKVDVPAADEARKNREEEKSL